MYSGNAIFRKVILTLIDSKRAAKNITDTQINEAIAKVKIII